MTTIEYFENILLSLSNSTPDGHITMTVRLPLAAHKALSKEMFARERFGGHGNSENLVTRYASPRGIILFETEN